MPRVTYPESYPVKYHDILQKCGEAGAVIRLPSSGEFPPDENFSGLERLLKLRGHFYAFIGAVKRSPDPKWAEMKIWASQTTIYLDKKAVCLVFSNRDASWQSKAFETAGEVTAGATEAENALVSDIDLSLARTLAAIEKKEGVK
jgi:hypothetical protein